MRKVPDLRFAGFDGEWEEKKFSGNFDTTIPKNSLSRDKLTNQVTRVKNIHYGDIHKIFDNVLQSSNERIPHIINDDLSTHERYFLQDGDIIFTDAAEDNTAGKCVELDIDDGSNIVAGLHTIPARPIKFGKYFYGFYLNSNSFHNKIVPLLEGTKVSSISKSNLNTLSVIVPKVEEQEKIGDLFRKLDDLIEIQEGKVAKMRDYKKSMLQKMFPKKDELVPEFRFDGFDSNWFVSRLGEVTSLRGGYAFKSQNYIENGIPILRISNINSNGTTNEDYVYYTEILNDDNISLYNGAIVLAMSGATTGKVSILKTQGKVYQNQRVGYFTKSDRIDYLYLSVILRSHLFTSQLDKILIAGAQPNISSKDVEDFSFKLPSLEEQVKIGQFFKNLDTQIENEEKLLDSYKMMKKSLLQKMFV